jgi:hypothetical protein
MNKPFAFAGRTWQWLQVGQCWELRTGGEPIARVVPDVLYPGMYRVERITLRGNLCTGNLSDITNLTRAKDAALSLVDRTKGMLCVACLEERLGRPSTAADFNLTKWRWRRTLLRT